MSRFIDNLDRKTILLALLCAFFGVQAIALALLGDGSRLQAPRWVVVGAGAVFLLAGLAIVTRGMPRVGAVVNAIILTAFGAVVTWVSFGPGERQFSSTTSLPLLSFSGPSPELLGRLCTAPFAIGLDVLAIYLWYRAVNVLLTKD